MVLETIYIIRHASRMHWSVNPHTVTYHASIPTPTSIPTDPALTSYGEKQAQQLGAHIPTLQPPISQVYSSPYYRCLQTLKPGVEALQARGYKNGVIVDNGFEEWYGETGDHREHPRPAKVEELAREHFQHMGLRCLERTVIKSSRFGEGMMQLHNRIAYALHRIIERADKEGEASILICTHAAAMIAIGRVLTGNMPEDTSVEDFHCYTASMSRYDRKDCAFEAPDNVGMWDPVKESLIPDVNWQGRGVMGGWDSVLNGDCSYLEGGKERGWHFQGDESFLTAVPDQEIICDGINAEEGAEEKDDAGGKSSRL
ncbi:phosphoglycerate mutase-like protein [Tothia fuscella]|uniref:Phosphoglycerate mutase-like protein n=1 Tax=Tothia fuscella TaxID=1048955 RepID=A0A9P4NTV6_9PEZI|nr:phosphoglycerate mutase-like protein [Tothia fuscella]